MNEQHVCPEHAELNRMVTEIHVALLGDFKEEGMVSKTRRHEKFVQEWNKLKWIFISAIVGSIVIGCFAFISKQ